MGVLDGGLDVSVGNSAAGVSVGGCGVTVTGISTISVTMTSWVISTSWVTSTRRVTSTGIVSTTVTTSGVPATGAELLQPQRMKADRKTMKIVVIFECVLDMFVCFLHQKISVSGNMLLSLGTGRL